jgi:hypothetical protein
MIFWVEPLPLRSLGRAEEFLFLLLCIVLAPLAIVYLLTRIRFTRRPS